MAFFHIRCYFIFLRSSVNKQISLNLLASVHTPFWNVPLSIELRYNTNMLFARSFFSRSPHGHCIVPRLANTSPCCLQGLNLERLLSHAGAVARARWRDGYGLVQFAYYKYPNLKFCICLSS